MLLRQTQILCAPLRHLRHNKESFLKVSREIGNKLFSYASWDTLIYIRDERGCAVFEY